MLAACQDLAEFLGIFVEGAVEGVEKEERRDRDANRRLCSVLRALLKG